MIDSSQHTSTNYHMHCCAEGLALQCLSLTYTLRLEITTNIMEWPEAVKALNVRKLDNGQSRPESSGLVY